MKKSKPESKQSKQLRRQAEELLGEKHEEIEDIPVGDVKKLIHELEVHQVELEMQNEEFRRTQLELKESRDRYFDLFDFAPIGYLTLNQKGLIIEANLTCTDLLGVVRSGLIKMGFSAFVAPDFQYECKFYIKRVLETRTRQTLELELVKKDGTPFYGRMESIAVGDAEGNFNQIRTAITDITERKQAEEELRKHRYHLEELVKDRTESLRESEEKFREVVETFVDGVISVDSQMKVGVWNKGAERIFGYTEEEMTGQSLMKIVPERYKKEMEKGFVEFRKSGLGPVIGKALELQGVRKDGTEIPVELSVSSRKKNETHIATAIVRDITKRKHAEEEKKKLEEQFRQSQKMEAIGTLAGGVAHDFNNLLTVIIGYAKLALMDVIKDESLREKIEEIKKAGDRAASLTRQLLAFSRKQIITPRVLDLNELLTGIEKMLGRLIGEDVELLTILEPALWQVEVDPGQMEQVIMNMTINAKDAISHGGRLTIETANTDLDENHFHKHGIEGEKSGHYVMLAVSDTGIGMDKENREHIFEPFFTTKEVGKGTGLGLSTVYGIVKQNNGFIWVYSEPGQGSTFKIYLPRTEGDADSEEKQQLPVIELDGSETILIVEDDDGLRKFTQEVLLLHGYKVLDAENGEDALRVSEAHEGPIHLMITDVVMPKMGGKELSEKLQLFYPRMKVVYMSGYTDNAIVEHGVLAPGLNFLQKPFTPESLARKVRQVLDAGN
ncbi:MAG TPA: PAS domain S-box protein [Anaerolineae bacterium]|nr:PAS domain S-box protein [Anaerolineae bacterium]